MGMIEKINTEVIPLNLGAITQVKVRTEHIETIRVKNIAAKYPKRNFYEPK